MNLESSEMTAITARDIILAKASRQQRARSRYKLLHRKAERKMEPIVRSWLNWSAGEIQAGLSRMRGRTAAAKVKSIADWDAIRARGEELLKPALFETLADGGNSVMSQRRLIKQKISFDPFEIKRTWEITKQDRFDVIGVEAVRWTTEHSAELVVEITEKTMIAIREYIETGIKAGKSVEKIARELRPLVGLTAKDMNAVASYHEMLILERPEYTAATQREMAETYARRLHRQRAAKISRTETAYALTEGQRQGYDQMGIKKLERVEDPDCCDICAEGQGKIYTIEEAAGVLPEHPQCEGTWVAA